MVDKNEDTKPELEVVGGVDISKLSDAEKQMLDDLNAAKGVDVFPPSLMDAVQPEEKVMETVTLTHEPSDEGKEADVVATGVPEDSPIPELELESDTLELPMPPVLEEPEEGPEVLVDREVPAAEENLTGSEAELQNCPHCGWDMSIPGTAEPTYDEKMGFLHSVLGQKAFTHQYELFAGKVVVRFRTLTTKEMDVVYNQVFKERESGEVTTIQDYWEKVNRYRLYLQLTYLSATDGSFTHTLPDGYSPESNAHAESYYDFKPADPDSSYLPEIEQHVLKDVLRTESIQRAINTMCARFNRLVAKLEAMIDNSDFWEATKEQS